MRAGDRVSASESDIDRVGRDETMESVWAGVTPSVAAAASVAQTALYDHVLGKWVDTSNLKHLPTITALTVEGNVVTIQHGSKLVTYQAGSGKFQQR